LEHQAAVHKAGSCQHNIVLPLTVCVFFALRSGTGDGQAGDGLLGMTW